MDSLQVKESKPSALISRILRDGLSKEQATNPSFSLRAYARRFGIPVGSLSQIMSGKRGLSLKNALKIADAFEYSSTERRKFLELAARGTENNLTINNMPQEDFKEISDWYYMAIMSLWQLSDCENSPQWVAKKLGISVFEATTALKKLVQLKLIDLKDGNFSLITPLVRVSPKSSTFDTRKYHTQMIQKSLNALETTNHLERFFAAMTFAINHGDLPKLSQRITEFVHEIADPKKPRSQEAVYGLNVQLFPLTPSSTERGRK